MGRGGISAENLPPSSGAGARGGTAGTEGTGATSGTPDTTGDLQADTTTLKRMLAADPVNKDEVRDYATALNQEAQKRCKANPDDNQAKAITMMSHDVAASVRDGSFDAGKSIDAANNALQGKCPPGDDIGSCMDDPATVNAQNQTNQILSNVFGTNIPGAQNKVAMPDPSVDGQIGYLVGQAKSQGKDATVTVKQDGNGNGTIYVGGTAAVEFSKSGGTVTIDNDENKGSAGNILADIGNVVEAPLKAIGNVVEGIGKGIGALFTGHASDALGDVAKGFSGGVKDVTDAVTHTASDVASDIPVFGKAISSNIDAVGNGIDNVADGWSNAADDVGHGQFGQAVGALSSGFKSATSGIANSLIHTPANVIGQIPGLNNTAFASAVEQGSDWLSNKATGMINQGYDLVYNPLKDVGQMTTDLDEGKGQAALQQLGNAAKDGGELGAFALGTVATGGIGDVTAAGLDAVGSMATDAVGGGLGSVDSVASGLTSMARGGSEAAGGSGAGSTSDGLLGGLKGTWTDTQGVRDGNSAYQRGNDASQNYQNVVDADPGQQKQNSDA